MTTTQPPFRTIEVSDARFCAEGLRFLTVKSPSLRGRADITLWLPEEVPLPGLPIVTLLHGVYGSHWAWAFNGGAHRTASRLITEGAIRPMVLAMPSDGLTGDGTAYLPHEDRDYEKWIVDEVPAAIREVFPLLGEAGPLCIAGLSMGGFGALRLAAKHSHRYCAASGHSAVTTLRELQPFMNEDLLLGAVAPAELSLIESFRSKRASLPHLRFDCGTGDALIEANRLLHRELQAASIAHDYEEFSGGHDWPYWEKHLEESLRFFDRCIG